MRAKEGGNERSCSSKFASYYIDEIPIKMIDIIGYDGREDSVQKLNDIINQMSIIIFQNEIHIILYLIEYISTNLFMEKEVDIFETLKLNFIKPKILFIRTKSQYNIYKENNNEIIVYLDQLTKGGKQIIENKLQSMNTNFQKIRTDEKWKNILNYICYNEYDKFDNKNLKYFNFDNVCFINLLNNEIIIGNIIKPFGMEYFKQQLNKLFEQIVEEEKYRLNYWKELGNKSQNNDENILKIIKDMNFYNISKQYLSEKSSDYLKDLVTNKFENKILIEIKEIPPIFIGLLTKEDLFFFFMQIGIGVMKNKDNQFKLIINKSTFQKVLEDFIHYKVQCISSIESLIFKKNNISNMQNIKTNQSQNEINLNEQAISTNDITLNDNQNDNFSNENISFDSVITNLNGINNLSNDCFMISTLQCLIHCGDFIRKIFDLDKNSLKGITKELYNLCITQSIKKSNSLSNIKKELNQKKFCDNKQHDSMEFGRVLLEQINKELNISSNKNYTEIDYNDLKKIDAYEKYKNYMIEQENSIVTNTFYFKTINIFNCDNCKKSSYSFQTNLDLPLLLERKGKENVIDLFNNYFKIITVEKICGNCGEKKSTKSIKFCDIPEILILCLQRYNDKNEKNDEIIEFNENLDLREYIDNTLIDSNNTLYELLSIINHEGNMDFGHYYSYIKINNEWYEFNDKNVIKKNTIQFESNKIYILYYERKK